MTPIRIDLSELAAEFSLDDNSIVAIGAAVIDAVAQDYSMKWNELVDKELKQSRQEYRRAMFVERVSALQVDFGLSYRSNFLAEAIEEGKGPFDEKLGLLASPKAKQTKDGSPFITVPFRHATPQAIAESGIFSSIMDPEVYDLAKNAQRQLRRIDLPPEHQVLGVRPEIRVPGLRVPEYVHKAARYEGLVRVDVSSSNLETRGAYMTFRRVSKNSDPNSWWNRGIEGKHLMDKALEMADISGVADKAIDITLDKLLNG